MADQHVSRGISSGRLEAFSDGVFAIAITLLVLELAVPEHSTDLLTDLMHEWRSFLAYFVSFSTIGAMWLGHSAITDRIDRIDAGFVQRNLLVLLIASLLPFSTRLLAAYLSNEDTERVAATIYGLNLLFASSAMALLWRYAVKAKLLKPELEISEIDRLTERLTPGIAGYLVVIVVGLFFPIVAVCGYLALSFFLMVPVKRKQHKPA